jgi:tungstate transport system substrate-binding protein
MNKVPRTILQLAGVALVATLAAAGPALAAQPFITIASTTSTEQSGLFKHLLPAFTKATGIEPHVVAVGTGQALDMGRRCDADVEFVHDKVAEGKFLEQGYGVKRYDVMYNDFVLIGPKGDPAHVKGLGIDAALKKIHESKPPFVSRADKSGTWAAEVRAWKHAGIDIAKEKGPWYKETGSGMGPALNTASAMNAYLLADRGTWLSFKNRGDLEIVVEGDPALFNQYGVMLVNPAKCPHVKKDLGQKFVDWVISPDGQQTIESYKINGQQLFFPNAKKGS